MPTARDAPEWLRVLEATIVLFEPSQQGKPRSIGQPSTSVQFNRVGCENRGWVVLVSG